MTVSKLASVGRFDTAIIESGIADYLGNDRF